MRFAVKNLKDTYHTISRTSGTEITIGPESFVIFDTDDDTEIQFWLNCDGKVLSKCGLEVITRDNDIDSLASSVGVSIKKDVSVVDGFASPVVEQEIKLATIQDVPEDTKKTEYTEENLSKLDKEDLFNICENFGIKYKRSNSVKTLVNLILGSGKV